MNCKNSKRYFYQMLDGEIPEGIKGKLLLHVEDCSICQAELKSVEAFGGILKSAWPGIEPSKDFERVFWKKALEKQKEPWFIRLLNELDSLIPHPNLPQMAMVVLTALVIGASGGVASVMNSAGSLEAEKASIQYLSGFSEFRGVPSSSVAAGYLKAIDNGSAT